MAECTETPNDDKAKEGGSLLSALTGLVRFFPRTTLCRPETDEPEARCGDCKFFDILKDPNIPGISNLCVCDDVISLGMQPEPHVDFGCKFFVSRI